MKVIYGIYTIAEDSVQKKYFYVGKTNNLARRIKEHERAKATGTEDKYVYMRSIQDQDIQWFYEELVSIPDEDYWHDHERLHVILLIREGHELMNMRHGDRGKLKEIAEQVKDINIRSAADVKYDRESREKSREVVKLRRSRKMRRTELRKALRQALKVGIPSIKDDKILPELMPQFYKILLENCGSIGEEVPLDWLIRSHRRKARRERAELLAKINVPIIG